jgi:hypothetical protein
MKRVELLKQLSIKGAVFVRHGSNYDIYAQPKNSNTEPRESRLSFLIVWLINIKKKRNNLLSCWKVAKHEKTTG